MQTLTRTAMIFRQSIKQLWLRRRALASSDSSGEGIQAPASSGAFIQYAARMAAPKISSEIRKPSANAW